MIPWKLWASVPVVKLWEAVALVLEIEPSKLKPHPQGWMAGPGQGPVFEPRNFPSPQKQADFDKALSFAERAANFAGPIYLRTGLARGMNKRIALVSLAEVVAFFVGVDWPGIPAPLLAALPEPDAEPDETKEEREDRRLKECEDARLQMPDSHVGRLPDGIGKVAEASGFSRQTYSDDVRAALNRREQRRKAGS